ncbi:tetratricopeptide repeat protein [Streptomyces rhizosphaericus]|uniref:tetratricopeptide repeat protein n=1 Tax=Streptomyces rhizosphaericus TaxID=114699 RepID=UPI00117C6B6F|nr:tetratricopeptide repeat protein [Streptomyces rhizosphaericus]
MTERRMSRQDFIRRRRQGGFIGRTIELAIFKDNLVRRPDADDAFQFLFNIVGGGGVGKTSLIREWEKIARECGAATASIGDEVHDALEAMESIAAQLTRQECSFKGFDKAVRDYRQRRAEIEASITAPAGAGEPASASISSTVASQVLLTGLGTVPGIGAIAGAINPSRVALGTDRVRAAINSRLGKTDGEEVISSPAHTLTRPFIKDLSDIAERRPWVVLFFDSYELTNSFLTPWLFSILFSERYDELPLNVIVVIAGRERLDAHPWTAWHDQISEIELGVFTTSEARSYLVSKGVTDEATISEILRLSGRLPVLVSALAQSTPATPEAVTDPAETAVECFLNGEKEKTHRDMILACAFPRYLNEDIYNSCSPGNGVDAYAWLCSLPFISDHAGQRRYHDIVRESMLRLQRHESPIRWRQQHLRLSNVFREWREELEDGSSHTNPWVDAKWRIYSLNETYHQLCADPARYVAPALVQAIEVCGVDEGVLHQWIMALKQSASDTDDPTLKNWENRIDSALNGEDDMITAVLTLLLRAPSLSREERAYAHLVRGQRCGALSHFDAAIEDFNRALRLDRHLLLAVWLRGIFKAVIGDLQAALQDIDDVASRDSSGPLGQLARVYSSVAKGESNGLTEIEETHLSISAESPWELASRAEALLASGRPKEALEELSHVPVSGVESERITTLARSRALTMLGENDEALIELSRAIELTPNFAPLHAMRSELLLSLGRHQEALGAAERALEISPELPACVVSYCLMLLASGRTQEAILRIEQVANGENVYPPALTVRGIAFAEIGKFDDAMVALNRVITQTPGDLRARLVRADALLTTGQVRKALDDVKYVLNINEKNAMALATRARAHIVTGQVEAGIEDVDEALRINPKLVPALVLRSSLHLMDDHLDEAKEVIDKAVSLYPYFVPARVVQSQVLFECGQVLEAFNSVNRVLEENPKSLPALAVRWDMYASMGQLDKALSDLDRALAVNPNYQFALLARSDVLLAMHRPTEALQCVERALQLGHNDEAVRIAKKIQSVLEVSIPTAGQTDESSSPVESGHLLTPLGDLDRKIQDRPNDILNRIARGEALASLDRLDESIADLDYVLALDPNHVQALIGRAEVLLGLDRTSEAIADLDHVLEVSPDNVAALVNRSGILKMLGNIESALRDLNEALRLAPDDEWVIAAHSEMLITMEQKGIREP